MNAIHPELIEWGKLLDSIAQESFSSWDFVDELLADTDQLLKKSRKVLLKLMDRDWNEEGLYSTFSWLAEEEIEVYFYHWQFGKHSFFACYRADLEESPKTHVFIDNNQCSADNFRPSAATYLWVASGGLWIRMTCGPSKLDTIVGTLKAAGNYAQGKLFLGGSGKYAKAAAQVALDRPGDVGGLLLQDFIWDESFSPDAIKEIPAMFLYSPRCYESVYTSLHQMKTQHYFSVTSKNQKLTDNTIAMKFLFALAGVRDFSFANKEYVF